MKISAITGIKTGLGISATAGLLLFTPPVQKINAKITNDTFEYTPSTDTVKTDTVGFICPTPEGSTDSLLLRSAPNPEVAVMGEKKNAAIVVDISENVLYHYDENGKPSCAYLVATGKKNTPTDTGVRVVTHIESYPYKGAPASTKRRKQPWNYGPKIICLEKLNPQTGEKALTGEFIHGNNNYKSLGKHSSLGCIRMDNEVIKKLAKIIKRGDIVLIKKCRL